MLNRNDLLRAKGRRQECLQLQKSTSKAKRRISEKKKFKEFLKSKGWLNNVIDAAIVEEFLMYWGSRYKMFSLI